MDTLQWVVFVAAVPLSLIVLLVFNTIWYKGRYNMYIVMVLVLFLSSAFIAWEAGHECAGEACEICAYVAQTESLLQSLKLLGVVLMLLFAFPAVFRIVHAEIGARVCSVPTLVAWKVRLNN